MKILFALAFLCCISVAFGLKCYVCTNSVSAADCDKDRKEQTCPSGYSCGKLGTEFEAGGLKFNLHAKGCYPGNQCQNAADSILKSCKDAEKAGAKADCHFSCCNSDLCNGGTAPVVSALLMIACAVVAFLR